MGNGDTWAIGYGGMGYSGYWPHGQWGTWGNRVQGYGVKGVLATWAMGAQGYEVHGVPHRQWTQGALGTGGMGHMGNGAHSTIGYRGMGNGDTWGNRVQRYGYNGYWPHGQWGHMGQ